MAWQDSLSASGTANSTIYAQSVSNAGATLWASGGIAVCTAAGYQTGALIVPDQVGGAIVAWTDKRSGVNAVYAQHVLANGTLDSRWPADGLQICATAFDQRAQCLVADGPGGLVAGGAIIVWEDLRSGTEDIYAQHVRADGTIAWSAGGLPICPVTGRQTLPMAGTDGVGGVFVAWNDGRNNSAGDIYAQHVNLAGQISYILGGVSLCSATGAQTLAQVITGGEADPGAYVTWVDRRTPVAALYATYIGPDSGPEWAVDGVPISTSLGNQTYPGGVPKASPAGVLSSWIDDRGGAPPHVYAQLATATGPAAGWSASGESACSRTAPGQSYSAMIPDGSGGALLAWLDYRSPGGIYARRIAASGFHTISTIATPGSAGRIKLYDPEATVVTSTRVSPYDVAQFEIEPYAGYYISSAIENGTPNADSPVIPNHVFSNVSTDQTLTASLATAPWPVDAQTSAARYQSLAFPLTFADDNMSTLFSSIWPPEDTRWRMAHWNPVTGSYDFAGGGLTTISAGLGYWIITASADLLTVQGTPITSPVATVNLPGSAASGWNQIANPYRFPIADSALTVLSGAGPAVGFVDAQKNTFTDQVVDEWKGPGYGRTHTLQPYRAYWIHKTSPGGLTLTFPNRSSIGPPSPEPARPADASWAMRIVARQDGAATSDVMVGAWKGEASSKPLRLEAPPDAPDGGLSLHVGSAGERTAHGLVDFVQHDLPWAWAIDISGADAPGEVSFDFTGYDFPSGMRLWFSNDATGERWPVELGRALTLAATAGTCHLTLHGGFADEGSRSPVLSALKMAYPNPFQHTVGFTTELAGMSDVRLEIHDLQGRLVRTIERRDLGAGEHVIVWDGTDDRAVIVRAGVYFARCRVGSAVGTARVVKLR